ncbi:MAG TPA: 2'-5' RNA ligase family protein [Mucilaginibacter sp.]|nr:2'-5' RNA ligase family protein [Mucilaginibacter sp.]
MKREVEYFFLISPPDEISGYVDRLKRACAKHIGSFYSMKSKAHISFGKFIDEEDEPGQVSGIMQQCLQLIEKGISRLPSCNLSVEGFDFFDHGSKFKTIYAAINLDDKTLEWFNAIKRQLLIDRNITPHITIARKIPVEAFEILWPHFQKLKFKESFTPESLTILTREFNKPIKYEKFKEIRFASLNTSTLFVNY